MKDNKKEWWKILLLIVVSGFFDMVLHALISPLNSSNISSLKPSIFVENGMLIPAIICWELLTFGILAVVFVFIQDKLPGKRQIKGLSYGLPFAGLYLIGMFESVLLFGSSMFNEFLMGLGDFIPILLMGILLGIFAGTDKAQIKQKNNIISIFVISTFYIAGRYFAYSLLHIQSAYITKPLGTFIWTLFQGLCVGTIFFNLQSGIKGNSAVSQALFFGFLIFGSNWLMNHLFIAVVAELSADLFIRAGTDILFVIIGVYTYKKLFSKSHYFNSSNGMPK